MKKNTHVPLLASWFAVSQLKQIKENYNSIGVVAHKVKEIVSFWSKFDRHSPNIRTSWKDR